MQIPRLVHALTRDFTAKANLFSHSERDKALSRIQGALNAINKAHLYTSALYKTLYSEPFLPENSVPYTVNPTPSHWKKENVTLAGQTSVVAYIENEDSQNTVIQLLGLNTEAEYNVPFIDRISKSRSPNIIIIELPHPDKEGYMPNGKTLDQGFEDFIEAALLDPQSPILKAIPKGHKITLLTHSAGAKSFEAVIRKSPERAQFAHEFYGDDSIIHTGIMLDTVASSQTYNPIKSAAYLLFSGHPNVRTQQLGTTHIDRVWVQDNSERFDPSYTEFTTRNAFHGQARKLKLSGIADVKAIQDPSLRDTNPQFFALRRTIFMGAQEPCTSTKVAEFYGDHVDGITVKTIPNARHNPLMECAAVYGLVSRKIR